MKQEAFIHTVTFAAGYDCINFECKFDSQRCAPGSGGSHGKHGLSIGFSAKGKHGAVSFTIYTGWGVQKSNWGVQKSNTDHYLHESWVNPRLAGHYPMPTDLGYHSYKPKYKDQTPQEKCTLLDGKTCYYDGSVLNAYIAMHTLVNGGEEAIWKFLDEYYNSVFNKGEFPKAAEYPKPLRKEKK